MLQVGQKVKVKVGLKAEISYENCYYPEEMKKRHEGQILTIKKVREGVPGIQNTTYNTEGNSWTWVESLFEPIPLTADDAFIALLNGSISDETYEVTIKKINKNN